MPSHSLHKEDTSTVHEPASAGDGRHCSLCWTGICGTQPQVDQLATPEGVAGHRALPNRRAGRTSRPLHWLRTYDQGLVQLVPYGEFFVVGSATSKGRAESSPHAPLTLHYGLAFRRAISLSSDRNLPLRRCGGTTASMASSFSLGSART